MIKRWCTKLALALSEHHYIPEAEIEVYSYGLQFGLEMLINLLTTLVIGFSLGMLWESTILFVGYLFLRSYTGGYHAQSFRACYILSNSLVLALLLLCKIMPVSFYASGAIVISALAAPVIFVLSPVQTPNKSLDAYEVAHHRRQSRIRLMTEMVVVVFLLATELTRFAVLISFGLASIAILTVIGAIRNRIYPI